MKIRRRIIMASESDGNYDKSFKAKGTTYYIEMLSGAGNYVAKWWDTSDNGVGYNNKGFVSLINDFNMNRGKFSPENIESLLSVMSDYDRKPGKPIQDRIKREVAKLLDFDAINSACGKKSVKAARRPIKAARTLDIYTWEELTPEQQDYVIQNWSDMRKLANVIYEWYDDDSMFEYREEAQYIADQYASKYGLSINPDELYWQISSQGPYPEWSLDRVFDTIWGETTTGIPWTIEFYGRGLDVQCSLDTDGYYDEEPTESDVDAKFGITLKEIMDGAQEYIDEMWKYINDVCQVNPDDEWVRDTLDANPDSFEFTISENGEVRYF